MVDLTALWLPILLSGAAVFFVSFLMWTALPHHRFDWSKLPDEDIFLDALKRQEVAPGMYAAPFHRGAEGSGTEAFAEKFRNGMPFMMQVVSGEKASKMAPSLIRSFIYYVVVAIFVAYAGSLVLPAGSESMDVFRVTGTIAILGHVGALFPFAIHLRYSWPSTWKMAFDGVLYGLATGGLFAWLWPMPM